MRINRITANFRPGVTVAVAAALLFPVSCSKDSSRIPDVFVDIYLSPSDPGFTDLNAPGGWVHVTGGSRGIIVYRRSLDEFVAYDRHCPYQPSDECGRVAVDSTSLSAVDACCGSAFQLYDGNVLSGPAAQPLKQYRATYDATGDIVHIFNQ